MPSISSLRRRGRPPAGLRPGSRGPAASPDDPDRPFGWLLVITGVVGWLASGALVLEKLEVLKDPNHVTVCDVNPWISCGQVMQTWQSSVFGFPNMFIGIVAFAVIITTGMGILAGATFARWYWMGLQTGVTLGFAFVVWLWSQALYSIHILCPFCMIVWAVMIPLFVWVTVRNISHGVIPLPAGPPGHRRLRLDHHGAAVRRRYRHDLLRLHPGLRRYLRLLSTAAGEQIRPMFDVEHWPYLSPRCRRADPRTRS